MADLDEDAFADLVLDGPVPDATDADLDAFDALLAGPETAAAADGAAAASDEDLEDIAARLSSVVDDMIAIDDTPLPPPPPPPPPPPAAPAPAAPAAPATGGGGGDDWLFEAAPAAAAAPTAEASKPTLQSSLFGNFRGMLAAAGPLAAEAARRTTAASDVAKKHVSEAFTAPEREPPAYNPSAMAAAADSPPSSPTAAPVAEPAPPSPADEFACTFSEADGDLGLRLCLRGADAVVAAVERDGAACDASHRFTEGTVVLRLNGTAIVSGEGADVQAALAGAARPLRLECRDAAIAVYRDEDTPTLDGGKCEAGAAMHVRTFFPAPRSSSSSSAALFSGGFRAAGAALSTLAGDAPPAEGSGAAAAAGDEGDFVDAASRALESLDRWTRAGVATTLVSIETVILPRDLQNKPYLPFWFNRPVQQCQCVRVWW